MLYTFLLFLVVIAGVGVLAFVASGRNDRTLDIQKENRVLLRSNREMRFLLNRIAREDVGNPALEAQLLLDDIDRKELDQ